MIVTLIDAKIVINTLISNFCLSHNDVIFLLKQRLGLRFGLRLRIRIRLRLISRIRLGRYLVLKIAEMDKQTYSAHATFALKIKV
jgi:hypothetical protein